MPPYHFQRRSTRASNQISSYFDGDDALELDTPCPLTLAGGPARPLDKKPKKKIRSRGEVGRSKGSAYIELDSSDSSENETDYSDLDKDEDDVGNGQPDRPPAGSSTFHGNNPPSLPAAIQTAAQNTDNDDPLSQHVVGPGGTLAMRPRPVAAQRLDSQHEIADMPTPAPSSVEFEALLEAFGQASIQLQVDQTPAVAAKSQADFAKSFQAVLGSVRSLIQDQQTLAEKVKDLSDRVHDTDATKNRLRGELEGALAENAKKDGQLREKEEESKVVQNLYLNSIRVKNEEEEQRARIKKAEEFALGKRRLEVFEEAMKKAKTSGP